MNFTFSFLYMGGGNIEKKIIIDKITECAKNYDKNLKGKNIMFLYLKGKEIKMLETRFKKANFMHLTGVNLKNKNINANSFYDRCIHKRIKENEIEERPDGNTKNKLSVLNNLMFIHKNARIVGDYSQDRIFLHSNKVIGNVSSCLGFIQKGNYYICNTSLKEDIRKVTFNQGKIICIVCKNIQDLKYNQITYINKKYETKIFKNIDIINKIEIKYMDN